MSEPHDAFLEKWKNTHIGLSYTRCGQVALQLLKEAAESKLWFDLVDQLAFLREEMIRSQETRRSE